MSDRTTLLFAMPGFRVLDVSLEPGGDRRVLVKSVAHEGGWAYSRKKATWSAILRKSSLRPRSKAVSSVNSGVTYAEYLLR